MHFGARLASAPAAVVAGAALWTLTEYAAHRWLLHPSKESPLASASAPHASHHRKPLESTAAARLAGLSGIATVAFQAARWGAPTGAAVGWASGYLFYDVTHWFAHHRPARTRWGRDLRRRHLRHHRGAPQANFGVTVSWWDQLFGTVAAPARATDG